MVLRVREREGDFLAFWDLHIYVGVIFFFSLLILIWIYKSVLVENKYHLWTGSRILK